MRPEPLRLLMRSYGLSAFGAVAIGVATGGIVVPLLTFWLGGALVTLLLGALVSPGALASAGEEASDLAADARRWEDDRIDDARAAARTADRSAG